MLKKGKAENLPTEEKNAKPTPAFLREDYPYKAVGDALTTDKVQDGIVYEIKCEKCEMSIRSQGQNVRSTYDRLMAGNGCIGCGNKKLVIRRVDMSAASEKKEETSAV